MKTHNSSKRFPMKNNSTLPSLQYFLLEHEDVTIAPKSPFALYPYLDPKLHVYIVEDPVLGYVTSDPSPDVLYHKTMVTLVELYQSLVINPEPNLDDDLKRLQFNLAQMFKRVH